MPGGKRLVAICGVALLLALAVTAFAPSSPAAPEAAAVVEAYGSAPKGITLEGTAQGIDPIRNVRYDRDENALVINGDTSYPLPVDADTVVDVLTALAKDDRMGVSIVDGARDLVYGKLNKRSDAAQMLFDADELLGAVAFGRTDKLRGVDLPDGYKPRRAMNRAQQAAVHFNITDFRFEKRNNVYRRAACMLEITLIPLSGRRARDGGYLPDYEAIEEGRYQEEDRQNVLHLQRNTHVYLAMPKIDKAARIGEVAAVGRYLQDAKIDLLKVVAVMK